ncbi:MAG: DEAD/DEAH box helicase [Leptolyngbyaceae cyanobacterium]
MVILHGSWLAEAQRFFLWGEAWQRLNPATFTVKEAVQRHPYSLDFAALESSLQRIKGLPNAIWSKPAAPKDGKRRRSSATRSAPASERSLIQVLCLPTHLTATTCIPQHSAESLPAESAQVQDLVLFPWQVSGVWLTPGEMASFLQQLPLGSTTIAAATLGADVRYWSHIARWGLDLLARGKYLPMVTVARKSTQAHWRLLLDSDTDEARRQQFGQNMPLVCRFYQAIGRSEPVLAVPFGAEPEMLLEDFLRATVDAQVRRQAKPNIAGTDVLSPDLPVREWLQALATGSADIQGFEGGASASARLRDALNTWTAPLQAHDASISDRFRFCVVLTPPAEGTEDWRLVYHLQSRDNADCLIAASTLWQYPVDQAVIQGQEIVAPQETLLAGLGRAARLCDPIRDSLQQESPSDCPLDPAQTYVFLKTTAARLKDGGFGVILPPGLNPQNQDGNSRLGIRLEAAAPDRKQRQRLGLKSFLNVQWELSLAGKTISQKDFERLVALETPLVEMGGQWVELRPQDIRAAREFFQRRQEPISLNVEDALRMSTGDTQVIDKLPVVSFEASGVLEDLIKTLTQGNQTLEPLADPPGFEGHLRPYQARGVSWLSFLEQWGLGACLADDMGLGKTIQLIAFLLHLKQRDLLDGPTLLVCPTSVLSNWEREIHKFAPDLTVMMHHGEKRPHKAVFARKAKSVTVVLTSYALAQRELKDLERVAWQGLVLDEAQNIKNPDAKQSKAVRQIEAQFRIALTGTPVENRLSELWGVMDFLNPGYLGPKNFFQRRFATPIERYGDTASLKTLRSLVQPFILRRLKTDRTIIQDLPEKQEMTVFCGLSGEQAQLYQDAVEQSLREIEASDGVQRRGMILGLLTRLKQLCNHPVQFLKEETAVQPNRSGKLQRFDAMVEELLDEGDRALIFTQFAEWGKLLQAHLIDTFKQETLFLYGSTSKAKREEMVDRFQQDPNGPRLFILSLKAGGVGLNLTRANHVFHFDRWWNPAVENQATDRAFRIGQTRNVQVHKFVCTGTLEERIHDMIESKKTLSEQVVGAGEKWLTELDTDQLRNLLLLDRAAVIDESGE